MAVFKTCVEFRQTYVDSFLFNFSYLVVLGCCLVTMMYKLNVTSIIIGANFIALYRAKFYPNIYSKDSLAQRQTAVKQLKCLIITVTCLMVYEYSMKLFADFDSNLIHKGHVWSLANSEFRNSWERFVRTNMCFLKESSDLPKACYSDWLIWLSLSGDAITHGFFTLDISTLLSAYTALYYVSESFDAESFLAEKQPELNDQNDFGKFSLLTSQLTQHLTYLVYACFPYAMIFVVFFCSLTLNKLIYSDLILCIYMLIMVNFLVKFKKLLNKNTAFMQPLRLFNLLVVTAYLVFQMPIFPCQQLMYEQSGEVMYLSTTECQNIEIAKEGKESNHEVVWYSLLLQSLGLHKVNAIPFGLIFIVLFTELQVWIFSHPNYLVYVLERMHRDNHNS